MPAPAREGARQEDQCSTDVTVINDMAFVSMSSGMHIVDVSTPAMPKTVAITDFGGEAIALAHQQAYVAGGGLAIFDVMDCLYSSPLCQSGHHR